MDANEVRKIIKEELSRLTHSKLSGMPDFGSANRDHDNRYNVRAGKNFTNELTISSLSNEVEDPVEGAITLWLSDGANVGVEPSLMFKITWDGTTYTGYIVTSVELQ